MSKPKTVPLILQAAFTIETLAHLQGREELLPQAQHLRDLHADLVRMKFSRESEFVMLEIMEKYL